MFLHLKDLNRIYYLFDNCQKKDLIMTQNSNYIEIYDFINFICLFNLKIENIQQSYLFINKNEINIVVAVKRIGFENNYIISLKK